jgi:energy-coupling factor transporter ATP-binding protein EcfA2
MNDQYKGDWDGFFDKLAKAKPSPAVLGVTDYFTLRGYKEFMRRRTASELPHEILAFANVEVRLTVDTRKGHGINLHLLVSPDDPEHVEKMEGKLSRLTFTYRNQPFPCSDVGLRALGRAFSPERQLDDEAALKAGANQFKVDLGELRRLFADDPWVRGNCLIAVAAGEDGLAGLARDAGFAAAREELGRFAHIVFSGHVSDRTYWLGEHPDFVKTGQLPKPCLHGSDAHELARVLEPYGDRRCWIRGDRSFESLRQTLVEPERRVHIGPEPPPGPSSGQVVERLNLGNAPWIRTPDVVLNDGLVTIIGAKGSGKTALADLLAFGAGVDDPDPGPASFIGKARALLEGLTTQITWQDGATQASQVGDPARSDDPRVQYLSQQFVERLSAPADLSEPLVREIERVVFGAIPDEDRLEATSFADLRSTVLKEPVAARAFEQATIQEQTQKVASEQTLVEAIPRLTTDAEAASRRRKDLEATVSKLPTKASETKVRAHAAASAALQQLKEAIAAAEKRARALAEVRAHVTRQLRTAQSTWEALRSNYPNLLDEPTWATLKLRTGDGALADLERRVVAAEAEVSVLRDDGLPKASDTSQRSGGLTQLTDALAAAAKDLGLDEENARRRAVLEQQLAKAKTDELTAKQVLKRALGAPTRIQRVQAERLDAYESVFETMNDEESALLGLYRPLREQIAGDARLSKLTFTVKRTVDLDGWVARGEAMVDLRRNPYESAGLRAIVQGDLLAAWRQGKPKAVRAAMKSFIDQHAQRAVKSLVTGYTPLDFGRWLFSTEHISVQYGIEYDKVEISRLSPGTRGVVLLTLYLALDKWDSRPLLIDQPEENLDPSSIYDDLVPFFRDAAKRRQIIMVTHNANLVVNTDSDQVIVASSRRIGAKKLPEVTWIAGGIEVPTIRAEICRLLEGGVVAFERRGRRYGVPA